MVDKSDWEEKVRQNLLIEKLFEESRPQIPPPSLEEALEFYQTNRRLFVKNALAKAQQIVLKDLELAKDIRRKILNAPKDFVRLARENSIGPEAAGEGHAGHVVLVGSGRVGQVIAQMLRARGVDITAIDLDAELIDITARFGNKVFWGDGTRLDILRTAGIDRASALVFAIDGAWDPKQVLAPIRAEWPDLPIIARAFDRVHTIALRQAGVEHVTRETLESAVAMGRDVLGVIGTLPAQIDAIEAEYRRRDSERLDLQVISGDMMSGADTIIREQIDLDPAALGEIPPA
jgi:voltage-gated potassium channel Kch